jgi:radical SAM superfamily enzyme
VPSIDTPLYPDFKVEAIKETPYENEFISKEKQSEKLVKLERVASDVQIENVVSDAPAKITISPSKRKYLEVVLKDLEKELQQNPNTDSIDMQVKKKEFEDLKKLLQQ